MLFVLVSRPNPLFRLPGVTMLLLLSLWAVPKDWQQPIWPKTDFYERAKEFEIATPGTKLEFQIHPPGLAPMILVKR
jgi:hypothetical protein